MGTLSILFVFDTVEPQYDITEETFLIVLRVFLLLEMRPDRMKIISCDFVLRSCRFLIERLSSINRLQSPKKEVGWLLWV